MKIAILLGAAAAMVSGAAMAQQSYSIFTPGQDRTFVHQNPDGSATVFTPGQPRTFISPPSDTGSRTVFTPGQPRTFINQMGRGYGD